MIRLLVLLTLVSCGKPITEEKAPGKYVSALQAGVSETTLLNQTMYMNFDFLPLAGETNHQMKYWSGDSWRLKFGSINYRWNSLQPVGRNYVSPHARDLKKLSLEDLKALAPTEKYDLWMGRYDYPLKKLVEDYLPAVPLDWEGLCHGWAGASLNHPEPAPLTLENPDGIMIPFGSADIKALLTFYYSLENVDEHLQVGKRCEGVNSLTEDRCDEDVTPADFHIILTNKIGLRGESFIVDIDRDVEVWNHPIVSYRTTILKDIRGGNRRMVLRTSLYYVDVVEKNYWYPTIGTLSHIISKQQLDYELYLSPDGNIIGGKWLSRNRPDFIWTIGKVKEFTGYLTGLKSLVK